MADLDDLKKDLDALGGKLRETEKDLYEKVNLTNLKNMVNSQYCLNYLWQR